MSWHQEILDVINEWWATHLIATTIAKPDDSDNDPVDTVAMWPDPATGTAGQGPAARVEMFGHAAVPPRGQRAAAILRRAAGFVFPLGSKRYRPAGMKEGESCLYCTKAGTTVWLKADGSLRVEAGGGSLIVAADGGIAVSAAAGKDVTVNGGVRAVARVGDACIIVDRIHTGLLATWMSEVELALNGVAPGSVTTLSDAVVLDPGITIDKGAANFKA